MSLDAIKQELKLIRDAYLKREHSFFFRQGIKSHKVEKLLTTTDCHSGGKGTNGLDRSLQGLTEKDILVVKAELFASKKAR